MKIDILNAPLLDEPASVYLLYHKLVSEPLLLILNPPTFPCRPGNSVLFPIYVLVVRTQTPSLILVTDPPSILYKIVRPNNQI